MRDSALFFYFRGLNILHNEGNLTLYLKEDDLG